MGCYWICLSDPDEWLWGCNVLFLLCIWADIEAEVYALSSNSWEKIGISLRLTNIESYIFTSTSATFVSGALHWLGYINKAEGQLVNQNKIISFDVNNDKFAEIRLPDKQKLLPQYLIEFNGNLAFITFGHSTVYNNNDYRWYSLPYFIRVMGEYSVRESWNKLFYIKSEYVEQFWIAPGMMNF